MPPPVLPAPTTRLWLGATPARSPPVMLSIQEFIPPRQLRAVRDRAGGRAPGALIACRGAKSSPAPSLRIPSRSSLLGRTLNHDRCNRRPPGHLEDPRRFASAHSGGHADLCLIVWWIFAAKGPGLKNPIRAISLRRLASVFISFRSAVVSAQFSPKLQANVRVEARCDRRKPRISFLESQQGLTLNRQ
jgi:hypothetical protein